ncbi:unnamed protein product [Arabidopsis halleri]
MEEAISSERDNICVTIRFRPLRYARSDLLFRFAMVTRRSGRSVLGSMAPSWKSAIEEEAFN